MARAGPCSGLSPGGGTRGCFARLGLICLFHHFALHSAGWGLGLCAAPPPRTPHLLILCPALILAGGASGMAGRGGQGQEQEHSGLCLRKNQACWCVQGVTDKPSPAPTCSAGSRGAAEGQGQRARGARHCKSLGPPRARLRTDVALPLGTHPPSPVHRDRPREAGNLAPRGAEPLRGKGRPVSGTLGTGIHMQQVEKRTKSQVAS